MDMKDIGEFGLIRKLMKGIRLSRRVKQGIGDDCAVMEHDAKHYQLLTTDALVEGVHFRKEWSSPQQIGRKAVEVNVSDIAAMGGRPMTVLVSFIIPVQTSVSLIEGIMDGIKSRCNHYDIDLVGGNISKGKELSITIQMTGLVQKDSLRLRRGAKPGQLIAVTGKLGKGLAGLELCKKGKGKDAKAFLEPKARLKESQNIAPYATSMIDITDGLGGELHHLADASGVGFLIEKNKLPLHPLVKKVDGDPHRMALYSGDELELLFTIREKDVKKVNTTFTVIGRVTNKDVLLTDGKKTYHIGKGFDHFL